MKKSLSILVAVLIFTGFLSGFSFFKEEKKVVDADWGFVLNEMNDIIEKINSNKTYLEFINNSKYKSAKIEIEDQVYFFEYSEGKIREKEIKEYDFIIKMNYDEFLELSKLYRENNSKVILSAQEKLPFGVKMSLGFQCLRTKWCRGMIL